MKIDSPTKSGFTPTLKSLKIFIIFFASQNGRYFLHFLFTFQLDEILRVIVSSKIFHLRWRETKIFRVPGKDFFEFYKIIIWEINKILLTAGEWGEVLTPGCVVISSLVWCLLSPVSCPGSGLSVKLSSRLPGSAIMFSVHSMLWIILNELARAPVKLNYYYRIYLLKAKSVKMLLWESYSRHRKGWGFTPLNAVVK